MKRLFIIVVAFSLHAVLRCSTAENTPVNECESQLAANKTQCNQCSVIVTVLNNADDLLKEAKKYVPFLASPESISECHQPMDCYDISQSQPTAQSGIYQIWPRSRISSGPISVYCDMEDDGGAWTVIQRRGDFDSGKDYFFQDWNAYKNGFGNLLKDFWMGNNNIFALTNQRANTVKFYLRDWEANSTYATYDEFWIDDENNKYRIRVKGYRGTAGDSFSSTNGNPFSTKDSDNDSYDKNCAAEFKGAWWYGACHASNLNGQYLRGPHESHADGVEWLTFRGYRHSLKDTVIKIRPKDFKIIHTHMTPQ